MASQGTASIKRKRTGAPKSRQGCKTCKRRHIKCDEAKPACSRCIKFGFDCDGYVDSIEPRRSSKKKKPDRSSIVPLLAPRLPAKSPFYDELEYQYFRLFRDKMTPHLIGFFESDFWERLIFQASENDDSIRHTIMAIAALKATTEEPQTGKAIPLRDHQHPQDHHAFALRQYGKAIQSMRVASFSGMQDIRTTLITCLLLMCFESFYGNYESARRQVIIALELIDQQLCNGQAVLIPKPNVEEELLLIFERMDLATMSFRDIRSPNQNNLMCNAGQDRINRMPDSFSLVTDARAYLGIVEIRLAHLMHAILPGFESCGALKSDVSLSIPDSYLPAQAKHMGELERWHKAFQPLLEQARELQSGPKFLAATMLELHYLTSYFCAAVIRKETQPYPNTRGFMTIFEKIVSHCETILIHSGIPGEKGVYVVEAQVVFPLYLVAWRCPQRTLRRKAISLLLSYPRREALWDSVRSGNLAAWIVSLEEENTDEEYIPEDMKINIVTLLDVNTVSRRGHFQCMVPQKGSGDLVARETVIAW